MKKSALVIGLFTIAAQGAIYGLANRVDSLAIITVAFLFILQGIIVYVLTDRESFENGRLASKDSLKVEGMVSRQVSQALGIVAKQTKQSKQGGNTKNQPQIVAKPDETFADLEITGL